MGIKIKKRKKTKYRSIFFKVTDKQKQIIDDYCRQNNLGMVQLIKLALRDFIERNATFEQDTTDIPLIENQLSIFDVINELKEVD